jgi:hypothetical protein
VRERAGASCISAWGRELVALTSAPSSLVTLPPTDPSCARNLRIRLTLAPAGSLPLWLSRGGKLESDCGTHPSYQRILAGALAEG